jgi:hypothetical protein
MVVEKFNLPVPPNFRGLQPDIPVTMYFQDQRHVTFCYCVMPNHCHVVVKPLGEYELEDILDSWKGYVGKEVNNRLVRHGRLWQEESYDHIVRDEEHLYRIIQYTARARLPRDRWHRWVHPEWEAVGWGFRDAAL